MKKTMLLLACVLTGTAAAQVPDLSGVNVTFLLGLAGDPLMLGLFLFGLLATLKRNLRGRQPPVEWAPWRWWGLAIAASVVCSGLLHLLTGRALLLLPDWRGFVLFAVVAALVAIVGRDGLKTALEWLGGARPAPVTVEHAGTVEVNPPSPAAVTPGGPVVTVQRSGRPIDEEVPR